MRLRSFQLFFFCVLFISSQVLQAKLPRGLGDLGQQASDVSNKRVERKQWGAKQRSNLMEQKFPIQSWQKHFSSLGSKRAAITTKESSSKKIFKTEQQVFPQKKYDMSGLNQQMLELHQKAGISMDDRALKIANQQLYQMASQGSKQKFEELGSELSLREINRFQFRHNRSDQALPVQAAGSAN
jgi:hypothetical protein